VARSRRNPAEQTAPAADATSSEFTCPECGRTFSRAAALGAHRSRTHGIKGSSKRTAGTRSSGSATRNRGERRATGSSSAPQRRGSRISGYAQLDRNQLLRALFPQGVPPKEDVIRAVGSWLDEAERLTRLK
jgi:Zinc finger, C2H2 type